MHNRIYNSVGDRIFRVFDYIILSLLTLSCLLPMLHVVALSFSDSVSASANKVVFIPKGFNLAAYETMLANPAFSKSFFVSVFRTIVGTAINLFITVLAAYPLSKENNELRGRKWISLFFIIPMMIGGGLIPTYLLVKNLGMLNTVWALVLPGCLSVYNMIVARTFFKSNISEELYEAAEIDGCSQGQFFFRIALPLSAAITAILVLYYGVGHWNSYFSALVYITDAEKYPLQLVLRNILITNETALAQSATTEAARAALREKQELIDVMKYSLIIISSIPVLLLYPFIQKHFVKGVMIGSLKG